MGLPPTSGWRNRRSTMASSRFSTTSSQWPPASLGSSRSSVLTSVNRQFRVLLRHREFFSRAAQQAISEVENHTVPPATRDSWRAWLMTGASRAPADRRRLRGANKGLKKILLEGLVGNSENGHRWQDFSGAMVRHAVDDAMRSLPPEETKVVKL